MFDYDVIVVIFYSFIVCTLFSIFCCIGNYKYFLIMINESFDEAIEKLKLQNNPKYKVHSDFKSVNFYKKISFKPLSFFKKIIFIIGFFLAGFGVFINYFIASIITSVAFVLLSLLLKDAIYEYIGYI